MFAWPPRPVAIGRYFLQRVVWPLGAVLIGLAWISWFFLTPSLETMSTFEPGWIGLIWIRNAILVATLAGGLHWWLYLRRAQGTDTKYNSRWQSRGDRFTFGTQTADNVFWTIASGVTVSTGFEVIGWWMFANGHTPYRGFADSWLYLILLSGFVFFWSGLHFYANHRLLHVGRLYDVAHALHHRNVNTGPWSGISMHPVEHLLYMSPPVLLWFLPGHPVVTLTLLYFSLLSPIISHSGFATIRLPSGASMSGGDYFHHLHHRYFECNYGISLVPLDKLFGTFHDGTSAAHSRMRQRRVGAGRPSGST